MPALTSSLWVWAPNPTKPQYDRFLTRAERAALRGLPREYAALIPSDAAAVRIFENAMCLDCLALVFARAWANFKTRREVADDKRHHFD